MITVKLVFANVNKEDAKLAVKRLFKSMRSKLKFSTIVSSDTKMLENGRIQTVLTCDITTHAPLNYDAASEILPHLGDGWSWQFNSASASSSIKDPSIIFININPETHEIIRHGGITFHVMSDSAEEAKAKVNDVIISSKEDFSQFEIINIEEYWKIDGCYVVYCSFSLKEPLSYPIVNTILKPLAEKWMFIGLKAFTDNPFETKLDSISCAFRKGLD